MRSFGMGLLEGLAKSSSKGINDAMNDFVDNNVPKFMEARQKRVGIKNRLSEELKTVVSRFIKPAVGETVDVNSQYELAEKLLFDNGGKIENIDAFLKKNSAELPEKILVTDNLPSDKWHGWKWIMHDENGSLYTNVGAPCNVCLSEDKRYASILRLSEGSWDYVARGVRNSVGFDIHPISKKLYFTDNGRDWLGDDSPSCELNKVDQEGSFYGFPYKHAKNIIDPEFGNLDTGFQFIDPIAELGAHVAPTGMTFYEGEMFPEFKNNILITLHGSWNRSSKVGYKVIRVSLDKRGNVVSIQDFISGWLVNDKVSGRPAAPFVMKDGSILISDDKANVIYRVTANLSS